MHDALLPATLNRKPGLQLPTQDTSISEDGWFRSEEVAEGACLSLEYAKPSREGL